MYMGPREFLIILAILALGVAIAALGMIYGHEESTMNGELPVMGTYNPSNGHAWITVPAIGGNTTIIVDTQNMTVTYADGKAKYVERDLVKNRIADSHEIDIRPCEHDVVGALYSLRTMNIPLGQSVQIPISDGKKVVMGRVEAQQRENVKIEGIEYKTVRYEAHLFNGVLYRRSGRLFVWVTEDDRRLPVQIRVRLPFYIGTVTLQLIQQGKTQ
jgi:hypothetical protein